MPAYLAKKNSRVSGFLNAKVALVTGATSGIGREIARQLACYGSQVLLCGRDKQAMDSLLEELRLVSGSGAKGFLADLANQQSLQQLIEQVSENYDVDILVNNAGFGYMGDFYSMDRDKISCLREVNVSAVVNLCRAFLPRMIEKSGGGILNVGSVASFFATPGSAVYGATKHFIAGFTDALHQEMLRFRVHITGLYPGHTESRFAARATDGKIEQWPKTMEATKVAALGLKGFSQNKIRVIPGLTNKLKVFASFILPTSLILNNIYGKAKNIEDSTYAQ